MLKIYKIDRSIKGKISNFIKKDKSIVRMPVANAISNPFGGIMLGVMGQTISDILKKNVYVLSEEEDIKKFKEPYGNTFEEEIYYIRHPKELKPI